MVCPFCQSQLEFISTGGYDTTLFCDNCQNSIVVDTYSYALWTSPFETWKRALNQERQCDECGGFAQLDSTDESEVVWTATYACPSCEAEFERRVRIEHS